MLSNHLFISNFNMQELKKLILFFIGNVLWPSLCLGVIYFFVVYKTGVTKSPNEVAVIQQENKDYLWAGPGQYYASYKLARIKEFKPEIISVGHSRCSQMRSAMFLPYKFFNACLTAWTIDQLYDFIDRATHENPSIKTIIFTLDYYQFSETFVNNWSNKSQMDYEWKQENFKDGVLSVANLFIDRPLKYTVKLIPLLFSNSVNEIDSYIPIGNSAIISSAGFRYDGSHFFDRSTRMSADKNNKDMGHILAQVPFNSGHKLSEKQTAALIKLGELANQRKVTLVGLQLPIIDKAVKILDSNEDYNEYKYEDFRIWKDFLSNNNALIIKNSNIKFFDMTHFESAKDQSGFIDPAHPGERVISSALIELYLSNKEFRSIFPLLRIADLQIKVNESFKLNDGINVFHKIFN